MAASARKVFGFLILAVAVAFGGGAIAQADDPAYKPEFLEKGFGVLENRVLEGPVIWSSQNIPNLIVSTPDLCAEFCRADPRCRSFSFNTQRYTCDLKGNNTFSPRETIGYVSGISMPSREFIFTSNKITKYPYETITIASNGSPRDACAYYCQNSALRESGTKRCRAFSAYANELSKRVAHCYFSESEETVDDTKRLSLVTGIPKGITHNFLITDMRSIDETPSKNYLTTSSIETCAKHCSDKVDCKSFMFKPSESKCYTQNSTYFSILGPTPDIVSGIKNEFTKTVQAIYLKNIGKGRDKAEGAITSALKALQEHFGRELGKTFVIAENPVKTITYSGDLQKFAASALNDKISGQEYDIHRFLINHLGSEYIDRKSIMFVVIEGLTGVPYGTPGTVVMSNERWNDIYSKFVKNEDITNSENLVAWSHELAHAFGLAHWRDNLICLFKVNVRVPGPLRLSDSTAIMSPTAKATPLFNNHFDDWEKERLLGKNINVAPNCSVRYPQTSANNVRPPSESYLRLDWKPQQ